MQTVEIKTKILNYNDMITKIYRITRHIYADISTDHFYAANNGKLMLRKHEEHGYASLISYKRSNEESLQMCTSYGSLLCHKVHILGILLDITNGFIGIVKKKRKIYYTDDAQINVDNVDTLGDFVEIKVVNKDTETAKKIVNDLMQKLSITRDDLITKSYIDLILEKNTEASSQLPMLEKPETIETSEMLSTSKMTQISEMSKTSNTSKMFEMSGTLGMSTTSESLENLEMLTSYQKNNEREIKVSSQLEMSNTPEAFEMPETSHTLVTPTTSGTSKCREMPETLKHFLKNREIKEETGGSSQLEMSETSGTFKMPGTSND